MALSAADRAIRTIADRYPNLEDRQRVLEGARIAIEEFGSHKGDAATKPISTREFRDEIDLEIQNLQYKRSA